MSAITGLIYTTTEDGIITPLAGTATLFMLESDGLVYAMLPDRSTFLVGSGSSSGLLTNNIIIPVGEGNIPLTGTETALYAIQLSLDVVYNSIDFNNLLSIESIVLTRVLLVSQLNVPLLETVVDAIVILYCPSLVSIDAQSLTSSTYILIQNCIGLNNIDLSSIDTISSYLEIEGCENLASILVSYAIVATYISIQGAALNQSTVDNILIALDAGGSINGVVDLTGGTSSTPSVVGAASVSSLQGKGWTVTTN